jgi:glycosyltransferase involved in cell wall biosynthesis
MNNVLHVINGEHYAGAERVQDLLAQRLVEHDFQVGFACLKPGRFLEVRRCRQAPLYTLPMRTRWDLRAVPRLAQIIRRDGYRLVHAHTPRTALIGRLAALAARVPMVYHVHSPTARDSTRGWRNRCNAALEWASLRGTPRLIAVSHSLRRHMLQLGYAPQRITVVHNGVPSIEPLPRRDPPRGRWTLGCVALIRPRKGIEVLLDAMALLRAQDLPVRLRVVGPFETPAYQRQLKDRAGRLGVAGVVEWTGFVSDVTAELRQLDLLVLPSLFGEGLPMVVLEAMACGVPVVGTRVEGVPEAIGDGQDGVLARPNDPPDLARAIARLVSGGLSWVSLSEHARARQIEAFSDQSMAAGVAAVYRDVLGLAREGMNDEDQRQAPACQ